MPPKKPLSDDAFSWVKKTEENHTSDPPAEKKSGSAPKKVKAARKKETVETAPDQTEKPVLSDNYSQRTLFVQYQKDGTIVSVARIAKQLLPASGSPFIETDNLKHAELKVPLELENESVLEIHNRCRVEIVEGKPYLVEK